MHELIARHRVEFSDTDAGGVVHFSRFFVFMENAEDEFLRAAGGGFTQTVGGRPGGWPKVAASCQYLSPARFGDTLEIHLRVARKTSRTLTYEYSIRRGGKELARGSTTSVCCVQRPEGGFEAVPLPADLDARIQEAPELR
ncbi:MAG TPA: thioesterase family protein [Candidatus Polarisedimenticolia bacterium]|nr:thioesterase family protein [Candidatus Polarisedimenticolia bacterium]